MKAEYAQSVWIQLPSGQQQRLPYALTVLPPFILAALFPDLFFKVPSQLGEHFPGVVITIHMSCCDCTEELKPYLLG